MENEDIIIGNAKILGTAKGWALPGGRVTRSKSTARKVCRRIANIMTRQEVKE